MKSFLLAGAAALALTISAGPASADVNWEGFYNWLPTGSNVDRCEVNPYNRTCNLDGHDGGGSGARSGPAGGGENGGGDTGGSDGGSDSDGGGSDGPGDGGSDNGGSDGGSDGGDRGGQCGRD